MKTKKHKQMGGREWKRQGRGVQVAGVDKRPLGQIIDRRMGISGNKWAKLIISFTLKIVLHFFFYRTTFKLACMNTHTSVQPIPTQRHAHAFSLITFFPILRPPAGVMNFTRFPKYLPTFLFELNAYLASSCCAHSLSYKHSITGSLTHESTHISPTPGSIHLNNHPQPEVEVHKNYTLYTPVW